MNINTYKRNHFIQLPSSLSSLKTLAIFLENLRDEYLIDDLAFTSISGSLTEAVCNAIKHGNKENPEKTINLSLEIINSSTWIFKVSDQGSGFDHKNLADPTAAEHIEKKNGRGVFIMKSMSDQLIFNEFGNEVELHFKLH